MSSKIHNGMVRFYGYQAIDEAASRGMRVGLMAPTDNEREEIQGECDVAFARALSCKVSSIGWFVLDVPIPEQTEFCYNYIHEENDEITEIFDIKSFQWICSYCASLRESLTFDQKHVTLVKSKREAASL
jgi:hypothetical protein